MFSHMEARVHATVEGLVQGVGFRWFVQQRARTLGLTGYVRNRPEGTVEFEAEGGKEELERLLAQVRTGPRSAQVTGMAVEWLPYRGEATDFQIR
jgi:acylphosphatase